MEDCQNYDFGANWDSIKSLITKRKVNAVCRKWGWNDVTQPPANFGSRYYDQFVADLVEQTIESRDVRYLTPVDIAFLDSPFDPNDPNEDENANSAVHFEIMDRVQTQLGYNYTQNQDKLAFYIPFSRCHKWNPTFGLWFAKKVLPNNHWIVRTNDKHTTVYCPEKHMVFDMLYWALDNRMEDHARGVPYTSNDPTLGGNLAFESSAPDAEEDE
jgi:hypothetical protein